MCIRDRNIGDSQQVDNDDNMSLLNLPILEETVPSGQDVKIEPDEEDIWNYLPSSQQQDSARVLNKNMNSDKANMQTNNDETYLFLQDHNESTNPHQDGEQGSEITLADNKFSYLPPTLEELMEEQDDNNSRSFKNFMFSNDNGIPCLSLIHI